MEEVEDLEVMTIEEEVLAEVDDEIYFLMKRVQHKFDLDWERARDLTNNSLIKLIGGDLVIWFDGLENVGEIGD